MNQLQEIFTYEKKQVRTFFKNNAPWFVVKDACDILGLGNPTESTKNLEKDDLSTTEVIDSMGRTQKVNIVNEGGLYQLIFQSRKPEAKSFKRWITHEVLPSIRKHGMYATDELLDNPDFLIETIQALKSEREQRKVLELENAKKQQIICELQPKATYYDLVLQTKTTIPISYIAKDYGMSATKFNELLHDLKIQYKLQGVWLLYSEHQDKGYTQSKTHVIDSSKSKMWTAWTQKGRLFLYEILKSKKQILPLIERECTLAIVK
jgi:anti-repressor protein